MKKAIFQTLIIFFSVLILSCHQNERQRTSQRSSGKTAELLIVTENSDIWNSYIGDTIKSFFNEYFVILPQPEPIFDIANSTLDRFKESKILKTHHNVLMVEFDKNLSEVKIESVKDRWAAPQQVVRITSPDKKAFIEFFDQNKYDLYDLFMETEYSRLINIYKDYQDLDISNELANQYDFNIIIPEGYYIAKKISNFIWLRKETEKDSQGILIYFYDYTDTSAFSIDRIISFRNTMTKEYIPGPSTGSYMKVADDFVTPYSNAINYNDQYTIETHGLWDLEGDFMGGPFVNYTLVDEKNKRVFTFDGYVYKPNAEKRDMIIQLEAIFRTIKFK